MLLLVMVVMLTGTAFGQQSVTITSAPKNQTVAVGDPVTLTCVIDVSYTGPFLWRTYSGTGNTVRQIYYCTSLKDCYPQSGFPSSKYQCQATHPQNSTDTYTLNITAVDLLDGARYGCNFPIGDVNGVASVVVIGKR